MASATADTNIYISGLQFGGIPRRFLDSAAEGDFRLDVSDAILSETLRILRNKFRWTPEALREAEQDIRSYTQLSTPTHTLDVIQADPSDNRILECAAAAKKRLHCHRRYAPYTSAWPLRRHCHRKSSRVHATATRGSLT